VPDSIGFGIRHIPIIKTLNNFRSGHDTIRLAIGYIAMVIFVTILDHDLHLLWPHDITGHMII